MLALPSSRLMISIAESTPRAASRRFRPVRFAASSMRSDLFMTVGIGQFAVRSCYCLLHTACCVLFLLHRALLLVCAGKQLRLRAALFLDRETVSLGSFSQRGIGALEARPFTTRGRHVLLIVSEPKPGDRTKLRLVLIRKPKRFERKLRHPIGVIAQQVIRRIHAHQAV